MICSKRRVVEENLWEFSCCLSIDGHILKDENCIPYKYCVTNYSTQYEYLHGARSDATIVNRCLKIPKEKFKIGGIFDIFGGKCMLIYIYYKFALKSKIIIMIATKYEYI